MRIDKIKLHGFTTYKDEQTLDLAALGPGIIAVAGPNGSGKTTLLEAITGAIYRQTPSRGSIASMATARDARIEISGENGAPFSITLDVDAHNGKQEALAVDGAGEPLAGPKVKDFDKFVAEHFPSLDVYLASFFASQTGVGSVLKMSRSDRRALFGRLLGLERLESMAIAAREKARAVESEMTAAKAALDAVRSGAGDVVAIEAAYSEAKEREAAAVTDAAKAGERYKAAKATLDKAMAAEEEWKRAQVRLEDASRRADEAKAALRRLEAQAKALEPVLARSGEIRAVAARLAEISAEMESVRTQGEVAAAEYDKAKDVATTKARALETAGFALRDAVRIRTDAETRSQEAIARLGAAVKATAAVPCAGVLEDAKRSGCTALIGHFKTRDECRVIIDAYAAKASGLDAAVESAGATKTTADAAAAKANEALNGAGRKVTELRASFASLRAKHDELKAGDQSAALARAEAEKAGLEGALAAAARSADHLAAEEGNAATELDALPKAQDITIARDDAGHAQLEHEEAVAAADEFKAAVVRLEVELKTASDAKAKAESLAAKLAPMETELAEWRWLGRGLGREGVQALELDAAGPRVAGLANELLADAYGSRFQIRFETQAAKADGKGVKETFDVVVVDTERGREGNGEDLSGGEKVIVGEALGLAVGLFHAQAAGVSLGTVIRDETVGALDPENGERYLAMLRAFLRVGRVHQLLYVAHNPALVDMADAVVRVEDGRIEIR